MNQEVEVIEFNPNEVQLYSEFTAQLEKLKADNSKAVFDYESPKGNKEARSHIFSIRKVKAALEQARKDAKARALEYGRLVDSKAKEIASELEAMIELHDKPLREIEEKEKARIAEHERQIAVIEALGETRGNSELLRLTIASVEDTRLGARWEEFETAAARAKEKALVVLKERLAAAVTHEAEQAELARLRAEAEARAQKERDEAIARDAAERARREAEEAAERQKQADLRAQQEREQKAAAEAREREIALERAQREKAEAEARAAKAEKEAKEKAERDLAYKQEQERLAAEKREADKKHHAAVNNAAVDALVSAGLSREMAVIAVTAIAKRQVPRVSIAY